ncbi:hypothetical protein ANN_14415 [Periplaneta americana]|uniref:Uncharacterized protein n=1 Tax=Periplaneta americana TaxID=6978 RepID=A0ABQ8SXP0_PERAM|nr:hypothetical protein ANN_14415 [Periplaneta americana]
MLYRLSYPINYTRHRHDGIAQSYVPCEQRLQMWFMHDGTPAHFFRNEREHLTLTFQDRWIDWTDQRMTALAKNRTKELGISEILKVGVWNVRSIANKELELEKELDSMKVDIAVIPETKKKLKGSTELEKYVPERAKQGLNHVADDDDDDDDDDDELLCEEAWLESSDSRRTAGTTVNTFLLFAARSCTWRLTLGKTRRSEARADNKLKWEMFAAFFRRASFYTMDMELEVEDVDVEVGFRTLFSTMDSIYVETVGDTD